MFKITSICVPKKIKNKGKNKGNCFRFAQRLAYFVGDSYCGGMTNSRARATSNKNKNFKTI
jgi:hypothetical protein